MNNSELLVRMLEDAGVRCVFGVPSGPVLPFIEALRQSAVRFVLTASETSAGFMAAVTGSLTGVPGVCVSTVGPGATNLTTGVGCAFLDRSPVLAITCNVATRWLERRIQMRIDHHALFGPVTKASLPVRERAADVFAAGLRTACEEPPGPVHIDFPEDVAQLVAAGGAAGPATTTVLLPDRSSEVAAALTAALHRAKQPIAVLGLTATRCRSRESLGRFVERQRIPFVTTLHAKGILPESHPQWAGVIGRARRSDMQAFTGRADLIIAIGYDPIEMNYEEWAGGRPIVHLSTEEAERSPDLVFAWNGACDLDRAIGAIAGIAPVENRWHPSEWQSHREALEHALRPDTGDFPAHQVLDVLRERFPRDGILTYDVGAHTHQIATQWRTDYPNSALATNGWSSMGYGMPAAYAARLAFPDRAVAAVIGDGGFQMTAGELAVARRLNLPVPVIVLNDGWLALMKVKQERREYPFSGVYLGAPPDSPPHYFGVPCRPARSAREFGEVLEWSFALGGPSVIEAFIDVASYSTTVFD